jgi:hypothetical protein
MSDLCLSISARERREIESLARIEGGRIGAVPPVSVEEMALALLQAHLVLIRDCGGVLPAAGAVKFKGRGGVSLSGGVNVNSRK